MSAALLERKVIMEDEAYVSIRQHTSAYVRIRQHTSALVERKVIMEDEGEVGVIINQPASPLPVPFERLIRHLLGAIERVAIAA